jgi:uncharacterized Zn-binding protein involved in type VI secretion
MESVRVMATSAQRKSNIVFGDRSECPESALPASDALHAALRTNVVEGLPAAQRTDKIQDRRG